MTWRGELPFMEGATWGDCQRFEMVVATALKRRIKASSASALGFEWLTRSQLEAVDWPEELGAASGEAITFSGLRGEVRWEEYTATPGAVDARNRGPAQLDAHRTMRNNRGVCALKGCEAPLMSLAVKRGRFDYCSAEHAGQDAPL
jgi:hypothetical protein